jgi:hypothetical protein
MSRLRDLKSNVENNVNLFDLFSLFSPDEKSKYTETLIRLMKKTKNFNEHVEEIKEHFVDQFNFNREKLDTIPKLQIVFFYRLIDSMFNVADLQSFQKFCEYNERGIIKQNDVSKYNSFDDILKELSMAEMIAETKNLEKQVKVVLDNDEWLLVRPLTFISSKKYGSNTKWCTTQENNPEYYVKFASKGVLIYCINKKTGYKVASFYSLDKNDPEFSFWDQKDKRIDSLDAEITDDIRLIIREESKSKGAKTNRFLLSDDERNKEDKILKKQGLNTTYDFNYHSQPVETISETRTRRIGRALERTEEDITEPSDEVERGSWEGPVSQSLSL